METAQFLELISQYANEVIALYTPSWKCTAVSESCKKILGYEPNELVNKSIYEYMYPEDLTRLLENTKNLSLSSKIQILRYRFKRKDGAFVWIETIFRPIGEEDLEHNPKAILAISHDITAQKSADEMVKKFVEGVENASDCIVMTNSDGQITYVNPAIKTISGFGPEEVIGKHANVLWGGQADTMQLSNMWDMLSNKKTAYRGEVANQTKDGKTYYTEVLVTPIFDADKNITFFVGISRDMTKTKEVDRMKNEFISLASHQLRTPITSIKWRLESLIAKQTDTMTAEQKQLISEINQSNERMVEIVDALLNISRIESGKLIIEPKSTSLESLMLTTLDDFDSKIKEKNIKLNMSFQTNVYDISVDPVLLSNVYANLLSNAIKYTPKDGHIDVSIYTDGQNIITKIADNGLGIPKGQQSKIFEKFFRAENVQKTEPEGTGLGLYLVKIITDASGGKVWFESEENLGSAFYVSLNSAGMEAKKGEVSLT